jgi:hypothetical protein
MHIVNTDMADYSFSGSIAIAPLPYLTCGQNARVDDLNNRIYNRALAPHIAPAFAPIYDISSGATRNRIFPTSTTIEYSQPSKPILAVNNQIENQLHRTALNGKSNTLAFIPQSGSDLYHAYVPPHNEYKEFVNVSFPLLSRGDHFSPNARIQNQPLEHPNLTFNISTKTLLRNSK